MADLDAQVTIHSPGADVVIDSPGFELVAVGAGGRTWRRTTVEGRYQHGRALLGAVLATESLTLLVRVRGVDWIAAQNRYTELAAAVSRYSYPVTVVIEGRTDTYTCEPGDIRMVSGDTLSKFHAMASMQEYQVTIPYAPVSS